MKLHPVAFLLVLVAVLAGCAAPPRQPAPDAALFHDTAFAAPAARIDAAAVFALSPPMQEFVDAATRRLPTFDAPDPRRRLIELLYVNRRLTLEYDAASTRTAAEAFDARAGNCLSLVIMTAALARASGLPVDFRSVYVDEAWSRDGDLLVASGHVNVALSYPLARTLLNRDVDGPLVVDFLPPADLRGQRSRSIGEATVVAMFMNNRAAEALVRGQVDDAYWWAREALRHDPDFIAGYNTLGVVYARGGRQAWASEVFAAALLRDPRNVKALANLARSLAADGRDAEARQVSARLAALEPEPPFRDFYAGLDAMQAQRFGQARELFAREAARHADDHALQFWLARANVALGDLPAADRHLRLALQNSTTERDHALYAAKLDWLRAQQH